MNLLRCYACLEDNIQLLGKAVKGEPFEGPRATTAVTVYDGGALCLNHFVSQVRASERVVSGYLSKHSKTTF